MKCYCCNKTLSNAEATTKFASGEYTDMCRPCLDTIQEDVTLEDSDTTEYEDEDDEQE